MGRVLHVLGWAGFQDNCLTAHSQHSEDSLHKIMLIMVLIIVSDGAVDTVKDGGGHRKKIVFKSGCSCFVFSPNTSPLKLLVKQMFCDC